MRQGGKGPSGCKRWSGVTARRNGQVSSEGTRCKVSSQGKARVCEGIAEVWHVGSYGGVYGGCRVHLVLEALQELGQAEQDLVERFAKSCEG